MFFDNVIRRQISGRTVRQPPRAASRAWCRHPPRCGDRCGARTGTSRQRRPRRSARRLSRPWRWEVSAGEATPTAAFGSGTPHSATKARRTRCSTAPSCRKPADSAANVASGGNAPNSADRFAVGGRVPAARSGRAGSCAAPMRVPLVLGLPWQRAIAMVFDRHIRQANERHRFSKIVRATGGLRRRAPEHLRTCRNVAWRP